MTKKTIFSLLFLISIVFGSIAQEQYCNDDYDVPFVPTKQKVVEQMLKMANVNKNDILYDLGCGDGRIVITAAREFGTRGVGIDINPLRISESKENAIKEGVADKVSFIEGDLFEANFREATVVTLYLLQWVNLELRPKFFQELRPGTRIVSHDFDMGEWEPDISTGLKNDYDSQLSFDNHTVYFWTLPANVSGTWELTMSDGTNRKPCVLHIDQKFQKLQGNFIDGEIKIPVKNIIIESDKLQFSNEEEIKGKNSGRLFYGTVNGDYIAGTVKTKDGERTWKAKRDPSTIIPIDVSNSD